MGETPLSPRSIALGGGGRLLDRVDARLEGERQQLALWLVVALGAGIAAWLALPGPLHWAAWLALAGAVAALGVALAGRRTGQAAMWAGAAMALGCVLIWLRAEAVAGPRIERPLIAGFAALVESAEPLAARGTVRLTLAPVDPALPPRVRVSVPAEQLPEGVGVGAQVQLRARLMPPPAMALPGGHDFARDFWFRRIGATGRAIGPVTVIAPAPGGGLDGLRSSLHRRIAQALPGDSGAIAIAFATGEQGAIGEADAEAMRRSGLTHLLSVSGLHIAAVIGAAMLLVLRVAALSERLALRFNLVLVAAFAGALAGIFYTLLTGAQVPTVRACIAALLVIGGMMLGRDPFSLRLIAVGALLILLWRPEALAGASFQFSFAAVTAIVVLHEQPWARRLLARREESFAARGGRAILGLLLTGLAVEFALMPLALYHFHRAGLYGVAANMVAIPLTTFVIMPLEAVALLLDPLGIAAPLWAACGAAIDLLRGLAHQVASAGGAVVMLPAMPGWAFGLTVSGALWLVLWRTSWRWAGAVPVIAGAAAMGLQPRPDLLVTGDGRHVALVGDSGTPALLRERSGDFIRDLVGEAAGSESEPVSLAALEQVRCSRDSCIAVVERGGRHWRVLAMRSSTLTPWNELVAACAEMDIAMADRKLPAGCRPRWLKLDRAALKSSGGLAIYLGGQPWIDSVAARTGSHPWAVQ